MAVTGLKKVRHRNGSGHGHEEFLPKRIECCSCCAPASCLYSCCSCWPAYSTSDGPLLARTFHSAVCPGGREARSIVSFPPPRDPTLSRVVRFSICRRSTAAALRCAALPCPTLPRLAKQRLKKQNEKAPEAAAAAKWAFARRKPQRLEVGSCHWILRRSGALLQEAGHRTQP